MGEATTDPNALFEREPTIDVFGDSGAIRVVTILIDAAGRPLPVSDIADQANIEPQTVYKNIDPLKQYGFIEEADKVGNATRYQAIMDSPTLQAYTLLRDEMIDAEN